MKIAVAQIEPSKGDVGTNIKVHAQVIQRAISYRVGALFFPELSLTGYEPELANELATTQYELDLMGFKP